MEGGERGLYQVLPRFGSGDYHFPFDFFSFPFAFFSLVLGGLGSVPYSFS